MFDNIITDLFPNTKQLYHDIGRLKENIAETLAAKGYYKSDEMYNKIRQLWDTIGVRHGVMLVGPTGSGKTVNWQTLKESINKMRHRSSLSKKYNLHKCSERFKLAYSIPKQFLMNKSMVK